jgi:prepilin-type N-terminal cleavage/methylation domain-containing protein
MNSFKKQEKGFTLVELLVGIVVGAIVIASLSQVVTNYLHLSQRGRYLSSSNAYAEAKIESLRNSGYNAVSVGTTSLTSEMPDILPKKTGTMVVTDEGGGIKKVVLTVSYADQGQTQTYKYATYLGELGVGQ